MLAASTGVGLGVAALLTYTAGLFVKGMEADFGLTRTALGIGVLGATLALALAGAIVGRVVDRDGPRRIAALGAVSLAAAFVVLAVLVDSPTTFIVAMVLAGLMGCGSSPIPYARAISMAFRRRRGLALGLMQLGIGISAAVIPPLVGYAIAVHGWRAGYLALAALAALGAVPALLGLPRGGSAERQEDGDEAFRVARTSPTFWILAAGFGIMALAFAGMLPNFVPMLIDLGVSPVRAAAIASLIGISVIVVRLLVGWLADLVHAPWIAIGVCVLCALGCLVLSVGGASAAPIGAIAFGAAMGAEADLVGFLVARYFPLRAYGRIYGWQYGSFMVAAGFGPVWVGFLADRLGSYDAVLLISAAVLLLATIPFALLPRSAAASNP